MKKYFIVFACIALVCMGAKLTTRTMGYENLVISAAGGETDLASATGYNIGVPAPGTIALRPKDLMKSRDESEFNSVELVCYATADNNDDCTMSLYGVAIGGAPERIGSLVWTFGAAKVVSGTSVWADTVAVANTHAVSPAVTDNGADRIAKVNYDLTGYRYLYGIVHSQTGSPTTITVLMRGY